MEKLAELVDELLSYKAEVDALEEQLKLAKRKYNEYSQHKVPEYMLEHNVDNLRLRDSGLSVSISRDLSARALDMSAVAEFLQEHGAEHLMQTSLALGNVKDEQAQTMAAYLADNFQIYPTISKTIHPQKLKAFIRELCLDEGAVLPLAALPESIGVHVFYNTKIK